METTRLLGALPLKLLEAHVGIDNLGSGGSLGEKCRTIGWEGQRVVLVSRHLQGCSLSPVLVNDRWVGPREQVLNVSITCR
jgi:hypothetical protein